MGQTEKGLQAVAEGLAMEGIIFEPELLRLKGKLLLGQAVPAFGEAETSFRRAIEIARTRQQKSFELRAVTSLSRLWQKQGKTEEARQILAEIYGWFSEGFDTADLKEARELLQGLS